MNDDELPLTMEQRRTIAHVMAEAQRLPIYPYPWEELTDSLLSNPNDRLLMVAYGSLINPLSAQRTLSPDILRQSRPVVAFGIRRTFDYIMPENIPHYGQPASPLSRAALNVHATGKIEDRVNGILIPLSGKEIPALRCREVDYDLVPVACADWDNLSHAYAAYVLRSEQRIDRHLQPHPTYYKVCREGAAKVGREFLSLWLETTFLGDGVTPVKYWETTHLSPE